jgi:hypothetical protein
MVTKGKTIKASNKEQWLRVEYSVKVAVDQEVKLQASKARIERLLDAWLASVDLTRQAPAAVSKPTRELPQLDPDQLAKLPWKTYRTKEDCKPDEAGWIFTNTQGAEALVDLIGKYGNDVPVEMGSYKFEVKLSGDHKQFLGRVPVKESKK